MIAIAKPDNVIAFVGCETTLDDELDFALPFASSEVTTNCCIAAFQITRKILFIGLYTRNNGDGLGKSARLQ
ncbi:hypothetical protein [Pantoea sp.]|uniref:hypothetical protein n=1 Tax=Pantoea sp. TaxID=69393 RepID=UPI0031DB732C